MKTFEDLVTMDCAKLDTIELQIRQEAESLHRERFERIGRILFLQKEVERLKE